MLTAPSGSTRSCCPGPAHPQANTSTLWARGSAGTTALCQERCSCSCAQTPGAFLIKLFWLQSCTALSCVAGSARAGPRPWGHMDSPAKTRSVLLPPPAQHGVLWPARLPFPGALVVFAIAARPWSSPQPRPGELLPHGGIEQARPILSQPRLPPIPVGKPPHHGGCMLESWSWAAPHHPSLLGVPQMEGRMVGQRKGGRAGRAGRRWDDVDLSPPQGLHLPPPHPSSSPLTPPPPPPWGG